MKRKRALSLILIVALIAVQSAAACTIFAVGKNATTDGSTMISHSCDSNGDDLRLWLIPEQEAGTTREIVKSGRAGSDFSNFPEVEYGSRAQIVGSYVNEKNTNQYIHGMYSFMNAKGLAMGESTCVMSFSDDRGIAANMAFSELRKKGKWDCYMLQDAALENCSTAREAVRFMGDCLEKDGWADFCCECINICDGNEAWVFEAYGGHEWCAIKVPDNAVFVAANRARINVYKENDPDFMCSPTLKSFAVENNLWDGEGNFEPCNAYSWNNYDNMGCTLREWRAITLLNPELYGNLDPFGDCNEYPLFVVPSEKISVNTIHQLYQDYYAGTEFDLSRTVQAGEFGNVLYNNHNTLKNSTRKGIARPINMFRATYLQIANVNASLPEEARCLVWVGFGAPSTIYLTPLFASATKLPKQMSIGVRTEYDENSAWWNQSLVQQLSQINYESAIQDIRGVRDPKMDRIYRQTAIVQGIAASMIEVGQTDLAVKYLTNYANTVANDWFDTYADLADMLTAKYMNGLINMKVPKRSEWWNNIVLENMGDKLRPIE